MAYQLKFQLFFSEKCQADFKIYMEMSGTKNSQDFFEEQDLTYVSCIAGRLFTIWAIGEAQEQARRTHFIQICKMFLGKHAFCISSMYIHIFTYVHK